MRMTVKMAASRAAITPITISKEVLLRLLDGGGADGGGEVVGDTPLLFMSILETPIYLAAQLMDWARLHGGGV